MNQNPLVTRLLDLINDIPEWMVFGAWDTPRCLWCRGFQHRGGHNPRCKRQSLLRDIAAANKQPGFDFQSERQ